MILSVIIPTYNRADALNLTLDNLMKQLFAEEWEVIVINNNCTDNTDEIVKIHQQNFPVSLRLVYEKTLGAAAARNAGARVASGDFLVFIDNDILTEPDFLQLHLNFLRENRNSWIVGQVVNLPAQENSAFGKYRKKKFPGISVTKEVMEIDGITGQNFSLPREDFNNLKGFDENLVFCSEDQELAMRARKQLGIKTLFVPSILVVHNDWAGWTFKDFCQRQQIYAKTEFSFWQKYGNEHPRLQMVQECLPINFGADSLRMIYRKTIKRITAGRIFDPLLIQLIPILESRPFFRPILWQFYKLALSGAIYKGFREGMINPSKNKN